ncbi:MAG: hypothetical protein KC493_07935 [Bacteriovoracaceae bacterium]|nr:hypothetical protein [Bacteriovoracaceae bacterium]
MSSYKKSLLIMGSLLFVSAATVWEIDSFQTEEYGKRVRSGRSIASKSEPASMIIIKKIDIRIYSVTNITHVISADRRLLAELNVKQKRIRRLIRKNHANKHEIAKLKKELVELQAQMETTRKNLEAKVVELQKEKEQLQAHLDEAKRENVDVSAKRDEFEEKFNEASTSLAETKVELASLSEKLTELEAKIEEQETLIAELKKANCEKEGTISELESEITTHIADKEEIMTKLEELEEELAALEEEEDEEETDEDEDEDQDRRVANNNNNSGNMMAIQQMMAAFSQQMQMQQFQMQSQMFTQINNQPIGGGSGMDYYQMTMMNNMMLSNMMGRQSHAAGGWGMPSGLGGSYDYMLSSPTFSLMNPTYSPIQYNGGIPQGLGFGGTRSPAINQGNMFTQLPSSL